MTPREPWSDDRVDAAFQARAESVAPPPTTLPDAVVGAIRASETPPVPRRPRRWRPAALATVAVTILIVVGAAIVPTWLRDRGVQSTGSPPPSGATTSPTVSASPTASLSVSASPAATSVAGLPIITVPDALTIRSAADDRELAVRGWYSPIGSIDCPPDRSDLLLESHCPDSYIVLQRDPDDLRDADGSDIRAHLPNGPSFELYLEDVDPSWQTVESPVELVVIGHFDDRRAASCTKEERPACRDRFVVDRVESVDGVAQPLSIENLSEPLERARYPDMERLAAPLGDAYVLSILMGEPHDGLPYREPIARDPATGWEETASVWFFRVLEGDLQQTYVRVDGEDAWYRIDGSRLVAADPPGGPAAGPTTAPFPTEAPPPTPEPARPEGRGWLLNAATLGRPMSIMVEDPDELLTGARPATDSELAGATGADEGTAITAIGADQVLVAWPGSGCDISTGVWISKGERAGAVTIDLGGQRRACDANAVTRGVVLDLGAAIDPTKLAVVNHQVTRTFPAEVFGLPVLDVGMAHTIRDAGGDDREIAVAGWLETGSETPFCGVLGEPTVSPLQPTCHDDRVWLLDEPQLLQFRDGAMVRSLTPTVAAIHPTFQTVMTDWPTIGDPFAIKPIPVVAIGHFDDPGATRCPPEDALWCRDLFVIDRIAWAIDGETGATQADPEATSTPEEILKAIDMVASEGAPLMVAAVPGRGLPFGELKDRSWPKALLGSNRVWWVKRLEDGHARSYVVMDKGHRVYRLEDDGTARRL